MNNDKFHCPKCKLLFDSLNHLPRILNLCEHTLCSYCINEQLHKTPKKIYCPIDKTLYENISSINIFKENTNLIEELQDTLNIPSNHNYEISNEDIFFRSSIHMTFKGKVCILHICEFFSPKFILISLDFL